MVDKVRLTVLLEDSASIKNPNMLAKHGLSFLIEVTKDDSKIVSILMDVGSSPDVMSHNVEAMSLDMDGVDAVLLSHGHYDHTGGLLEVLRLVNNRVPVVAHPKLFSPKLKLKPKLKFVGPPFHISDVETAGGVMLFANTPVKITEGVMTSGEIERQTAFEEIQDFWTVDEGVFTEDAMPDDQSLYIDIKGRGLVVLTGCAHSGVINTVKHAQRVMGVSEIHSVIGGFHLVDASEDRIKSTIDEFIKLDPKVIRPCHCTGSKAVHQLLNAFGERCSPIQTGDIVEI